MKTLEQLKKRIDFQQTDEFCLNFLHEIAERGIITIGKGDIFEESGVTMVSDDFYLRCCMAWGVEPDVDEED
ncbi:hypothetical protein GTGU_00178 [Trabulsiella guamensis ATCC 49490]|uniref:Uncharacterized protein n=1 Tax=Trabulsiella guamensis ATCC 49490 TaxID=1005994 RepID=A0A085ASA7_9ENTR|nr:hypothetical protein [Trabulsiella guamensis]KFC13102.1 hypothetical protein GTGU_00178 [Trabulsiella guamensis ATCC 49490]